MTRVEHASILEGAAVGELDETEAVTMAGIDAEGFDMLTDRGKGARRLRRAELVRLARA